MDESAKSFYLVSIGEKAELIAKRYKERQRSTQETLEALKSLIAIVHELLHMRYLNHGKMFNLVLTSYSERK